MRPRTNFDVIDKNTGEIFMKSRSKDCFGEYTNFKKTISKGKDHIVTYYLPKTFIMPERIGEKYFIYKYDVADELIFSDEEINIYLEWLNKNYTNMNVSRIEDLTITEDNSKEILGKNYNFGDNLGKKIELVRLNIDLTKTINDKDRKIHLFFPRYLINNFGNKVLFKTFKTIKKYDIDFWDAFIMNEFITINIEGSGGYNIFGGLGIFKYFTLEDFYNKVIVENPEEFMYNNTYIETGWIPYFQNGHDYGDKYMKQNRARNEFNKFYKENKSEATPEFLEFWKNYNWIK